MQKSQKTPPCNQGTHSVADSFRKTGRLTWTISARQEQKRDTHTSLAKTLGLPLSKKLTDFRAWRRRFSAAASVSARLSQKVEAAGPPDPTIGTGRCSPERGCHEVTGVEKSEIPFDRMFGTCADEKSPANS